MNLSMIESLLMGLLSGLTQVLPVSAEAHQTILKTFYGIEAVNPVLSLMIHIGSLIAIHLYFQNELHHLQYTGKLMRISPKRRRQPLDPGAASTVRLLRSAASVMAVCKLLTLPLAFIGDKLNLMTGTLILNGLLLLVPALCRSGNMNSRNMPRLYGWLMGMGAGLSVLPGVSQIGASMSLGQWRGVDRQFAWRFSGMLLIPGIAIGILFDVLAIFMVGIGSVTGIAFVSAIAAGIAAAAGTWMAAKIMEELAVRIGFTFFSYYSWGMAMLCFVLFLMIY